MARKSIAEALKEISEISDKTSRINVLRSAIQQQPAIFEFFKVVFDPKFVFLLPKGQTPYKANDIPGQEAVLFSKIRLFYLFVGDSTANNSPLSNIDPIKRERLWVELMESITKEDAELLDYVKDNKKLPWKSLSRDIIEVAFPGMIPLAPKATKKSAGDKNAKKQSSSN